MKTENPNSSVSQNIQALWKNFDEVKAEVQSLCDRIERAEEFFSTLAGRTEAETIRDYAGSGGKRGQLRLAVWRAGQTWKLHYSVSERDAVPEYKLLQDASIRIKITAMEMLPELLDVMLMNQKELLARTRRVNAEFDIFIEEVKQIHTKKSE